MKIKNTKLKRFTSRRNYFWVPIYYSIHYSVGYYNDTFHKKIFYISAGKELFQILNMDMKWGTHLLKTKCMLKNLWVSLPIFIWIKIIFIWLKQFNESRQGYLNKSENNRKKNSHYLKEASKRWRNTLCFKIHWRIYSGAEK